MTSKTHIECPICHNQVHVGIMVNHIMNHLKEECEDFSLAVKKNKC